jgi:hypothetical protein
MTRRKSAPMEMIEDIKPDRLYRTTLSNQIFGYGQQRTKDLIDAGELPLPFPLSPSSRYRGWLGAQIIEHRARMRELAAANLEIERTRAPQQQPLALQPKIKKLKLRSPK